LAKVAFVYPPYTKDGKYPHLSQNRQVRFTASTQVKIYPLIPASLLTLVSKRGHTALLLDAINRRLPREVYESDLVSFDPDVIVLEAKTPIMPKLWREVAQLKKLRTNATIVIVGDHVTARPQETMQQCACDYIAVGGDYDAIVADLVDAITSGLPLPRGVVSRTNMESADPSYVGDLDTLPPPDRELTRWRDYGEAYLNLPAMYILSGRGCGRRGAGHAGCTFCSWQQNLWRGHARLRSPRSVIEEMDVLVRRYGVNEFFDDNESGGLWSREWTKEFCERMRSSGLRQRTMISSNARADSLNEDTCRDIAAAGFRLLKVGLESASDATLQRLNKGEAVEEIRAGVMRAKDRGLRVLLTMMIGYPWETEEEARSTFELARELLIYKARFGDALQCSVVVPYPGTSLFCAAAANGWNAVGLTDYERYDMDTNVLTTGVDTRYWCGRIWRLYLNHRYLCKLVGSTRSVREFRLGLRGLRSLVGHLSDYGAERRERMAVPARQEAGR
jgi:anaerobic magnesium-protoporphyrin IX monomethyl ester cyclase